jgi:hypothetical protein
MTTLFVYGDSFASFDSMGDSWVDILARRLGITGYNRAVSGGSTEHAVKCFIKDNNDNLIGDGDIVIFVTSTPGRLHFQFQADRPETASKYLHYVDTRDPTHVWYKENKQYIAWCLLNFDFRINAINHEGYLHILKNYAESHPNRQIIVLANSDHNFFDNVTMPIGNVPSNFLRPKIFLNTVSKNEIVGQEEYNQWVTHTGWDVRVNHLSNPNLAILADRIIEALETKSVSHFTYDKFKRGILEHISTKRQYADYINQKILYLTQPIMDNLPN